MDSGYGLWLYKSLNTVLPREPMYGLSDLIRANLDNGE